MTFERFFAAAYNVWDGSMRKKPTIHVQVRRRGVTFCASVIKLGDTMTQGQWFKVHGPDIGTTWCESRQVRLCSGDGHCACEAAAGGAPLAGKPAKADQALFDTISDGRFSQAGVVAPPESLTDEISHVDARCELDGVGRAGMPQWRFEESQHLQDHSLLRGER